MRGCGAGMTSIQQPCPGAPGPGVKNRKIPLADLGFGQYSVQDSFMHQVAKWEISVAIFGRIGTAGSVSLRKLVKRNAKR